MNTESSINEEKNEQPNNSETARNHSKTSFTKGEICLFYNVIFTFVLILLLLLVYIIHLFTIQHKGNDSFSIVRKHGKYLKSSFDG